MAPKEGSSWAPLKVVLARSCIERISVTSGVEATRSRNLVVAEQLDPVSYKLTNSKSSRAVATHRVDFFLDEIE